MKIASCILAIVLSATVCLGASITIENHSFEIPDSSGGSWPMAGYDIDGNGWTVTNHGQGGFSRAVNCAAAVIYNGHPIPPGQGAQVGLNQFGHTLYQDLAASYASGKIYILTSLFGFSNQQPQGSMELSLQTSSGTVLGSSTYSPPAAFVQTNAVVTVDMADHPGEVGQTIRVSIKTTQTGGQSNFAFDLVELEEIPEPAVGIFALIGILAIRKFRA